MGTNDLARELRAPLAKGRRALLPHLATALLLWSVSQRPAEGLGLEKQQA